MCRIQNGASPTVLQCLGCLGGRGSTQMSPAKVCLALWPRRQSVSHKICIWEIEQHLLSLFWIFLNIWRSSTFLVTSSFSRIHQSSVAAVYPPAHKTVGYININFKIVICHDFCNIVPPNIFALPLLNLFLWSVSPWHVSGRLFIESFPPFRESWNDSTQHPE